MSLHQECTEARFWGLGLSVAFGPVAVSLCPALTGPGLKACPALCTTRSRMLSTGHLQEGTRARCILRHSSSAPSRLPLFLCHLSSSPSPSPCPFPCLALFLSFCLSLSLLVNICDWSGYLSLCPNLSLHPCCLLSRLFSPISVCLSCLSISLSCLCHLPDPWLSSLFSLPPFSGS